jgi:hypothetical protein
MGAPGEDEGDAAGLDFAWSSLYLLDMVGLADGTSLSSIFLAFLDCDLATDCCCCCFVARSDPVSNLFIPVAVGPGLQSAKAHVSAWCNLLILAFWWAWRAFQTMFGP